MSGTHSGVYNDGASSFVRAPPARALSRYIMARPQLVPESEPLVTRKVGFLMTSIISTQSDAQRLQALVSREVQGAR
jgi:hypothetical protein